MVGALSGEAKGRASARELKHRVTFLSHGVSVSMPAGATLFDAANWAGVPIESVCGGHGTCHQCRLKLVEPSGDRWVLACQTRVGHDCTVEVSRPASLPRTAPLAWHSPVPLCPNVHKELLPSGTLETAVVCGDELIAIEPGDTRARNFGLALDVGTTTVVAALVNLETGATEASESLLNRQVAFGADVITRISYAAEHEHGLADLQASLAATISELVDRILANSEVARQEIYEAVAVGNTTMIHFLLGVDPSGIGVSPFVPAFRGPITVRASDVGLRLHPEARLDTLPLLGGYVGADIVSGLLAAEFLRKDDRALRLFIDIGTNSEVVMRRRARCFCAAAPAGPAFEGAHIQCGMRATAGAIGRVEIGEDVRLGLIGGAARPRGICGSGLVDAVAQLRKLALIDESGRLMRAEAACGRVSETVRHRLGTWNGTTGFLLSDPEDAIVLTQHDIRQVQSAKAAVAAAITVLLSRFGAGPDELDEILLAGAFGSDLDPASARIIGLVPSIPLSRIRPIGNAAAEGAVIALLSRRERAVAARIPEYVEYVELSTQADFNVVFTELLGFPTDMQFEHRRKSAQPIKDIQVY